MKDHFWPFTEVQHGNQREVMWKVGFNRNHGLRGPPGLGAQAASLPLSAASQNACRNAQSSNIEIGSRQAAATGRRPVLPRRIPRLPAMRVSAAATKISSLVGSTRTGL